MRLKQFIGKDIRGYMNLDIIFKENVTFLIGINGSGKTTVLKLLAGLLTPSYTDLAEIEFSEITLICLKSSEVNDEIQINCTKKDNDLLLTYKDKNINIEDEIKIFENYHSSKQYQRRFDKVYDEKLERDLLTFDKLKTVRQIKKLNNPLFLGLNRRIINRSSENFERDILLWRRRIDNIDFEIDMVDNALRDVQDIVFDLIRQNARKQAEYSDNFRKQVLQDSFEFVNSPERISKDYQENRKKLMSKKKELTNAISELVTNDISEKLESLFKKLLETLEDLSRISEQSEESNKYYDTLMKWLVNSYQLDRIDKLISSGNKYAKDITALKLPINRFKDSVNLFF